jgi:hypothetical protein
MNCAMKLLRQQRTSGAALIIVLAFVVLLLVLALAYFSRTVTDRRVAHSSFNQSKADEVALSAADVIVADLQQEIFNGSAASISNNYTLYTPNSNANMLPMRSGTPSPTPAPGSPDPLPNLIRRSYNSGGSPPDPIASPGVPSRASAVNSTTGVSLNGRSISLARWNKHYLLPRYNPSSTAIDSTPPSPLSNPYNPNPSVATGFTPPDWVLVTRNGPGPSPTPFASWNSSLSDATATNGNYAIGRYAYAIYDEGGLIDVNVAGFPYATPLPTPTPPAPPQPIYAPSPPYAQGSYPSGYTAATYTAQKIGRKGTAAFADLSMLPAVPSPSPTSSFFLPAQINNLIGWRNFASAQPGSNLAAGFTFDPAAATRYYSLALSSVATFLQTSGAVWNNSTDQAFLSRQELLALRTSTQFSQNLLQYLGTFSREYNRPSWKPATTSAINPDLSGVLVTSGFTRLDQTAASQGEPLLKNRFPLRRLSWLTYKGPSATRTPFPPASPTLPPTDPNYDMWQLLYTYGVPQIYLQQGTAANIKASFGLVWDTRPYVASPRAGQQWVYTSPNSAHSGGTFSGTSGSTATVVKTLTTVQRETREPDFFEILKATILNGSVGLGSNNTANTFVVADGKYYDTTNGKSADYQIMQVGVNIIDAWDTDNIPTFISFGSDPTSSPANQPYVLAGIENLPYLNKLVFVSSFASGSGDFFNAWLVPSLWNPHQNAPGTGTIRVSLNGPGSYTATGNDKTGSSLVPTTTSGPIAPLPATMDVNVSSFGTSPSPQTATPIANTTSVSQVIDPSFTYWGFHYPFTSNASTQAVNKTNADSAWPDFGSGGGSVQLQIQIPGTTTFIPYQTWKIAAINHPLTCQNAKNNFGTSNKLQDPEFVALDPRSARFGIWGTDANGQTSDPTKKDYLQGATDSLDEQAPATRLQQITLYQPQGPSFTIPTLASLYLLSANSSTDFYKDLDGVQRVADFTTGNPTSNGTTIMFGTNSQDRPRILSGPFQSVAELGQVFRDQPWKTLAFTIANSGDAGLLDAFTLQDVSITGVAPSSQYVWMTDGRTSLNTRQAPVLTAIMSQVSKAIAGTGIIPTSSTDTTVSNIANVLVKLTTTTPMISKGDLVARLAGDASVTGLGNKEAREAVMRALSDAGQTRTWNLMIDVIAQSGRYPASATNLSQFVVEGEQRYWVHIAIDRFTGQVIDRQVELVKE